MVVDHGWFSIFHTFLGLTLVQCDQVDNLEKDKRVLVALEVRVFVETKDGVVSEGCLVEDLEEVDLDEKGKNGLVCLAEDAPVLLRLVLRGSGRGASAHIALHQSYSRGGDSMAIFRFVVGHVFGRHIHGTAGFIHAVFGALVVGESLLTRVRVGCTTGSHNGRMWEQMSLMGLRPWRLCCSVGL